MMDTAKFLAAKYQAREADVPVPALAEFFGDEPAVWRVRALDASELCKAREARNSSANLQHLVDALAGDGSEKGAQIRKMMGLSDDVPGDVSQRIEMLSIGSVNPAIKDQRDVAVKLAEVHPVVFYQLTNKIHELTGMGLELGKPKRSGATPASEQPSRSATKKSGSSSKRGRTSSRKAS